MDAKIARKLYSDYQQQLDRITDSEDVFGLYSEFIQRWKEQTKAFDGRKLLQLIVSEKLDVSHDCVSIDWNSETQSWIQSMIHNCSDPIIAERWHYIVYDKYHCEKSRIAIDALENEDSISQMLELIPKEPVLPCSLEVGDSVTLSCPMKLALSSANGSDRHGASKEQGSRVFNMAINLDTVPITGSIELIADAKIVIESYNDLSGKFETKTLVIDGNNIDSAIFSCPPDEVLTPNSAFSNAEDPFRFFKFCILFSGIVDYMDSPKTYIQNPKMIWKQLMAFTNGNGILLRLRNQGPSQSGLSSSSAVMVSILSLLYKFSNQKEKSSMVLDLGILAENLLGLRSGWNDTYALLPGIHDFETVPSNLPRPQLVTNEFPISKMQQRLRLIHTGIQRKATGRMNRRHEIYLSRHQDLYPYLLASFKIHAEIVNACQKEDFRKLGKLLRKYMEFRVKFDQDAISAELESFFDVLENEKVIEGGLLSGAMGGGIAIVVLTDYALQNEKILESTLLKIKDLNSKDGKFPFNNNLFGLINYSINTEGIVIS